MIALTCLILITCVMIFLKGQRRNQRILLAILSLISLAAFIIRQPKTTALEPVLISLSAADYQSQEQDEPNLFQIIIKDDWGLLCSKEFPLSTDNQEIDLQLGAYDSISISISPQGRQWRLINSKIKLITVNESIYSRGEVLKAPYHGKITTFRPLHNFDKPDFELAIFTRFIRQCPRGKQETLPEITHGHYLIDLAHVYAGALPHSSLGRLYTAIPGLPLLLIAVLALALALPFPTIIRFPSALVLIFLPLLFIEIISCNKLKSHAFDLSAPMADRFKACRHLNTHPLHALEFHTAPSGGYNSPFLIHDPILKTPEFIRFFERKRGLKPKPNIPLQPFLTKALLHE